MTGPGGLLTAALPAGWVEDAQATNQLWNGVFHDVTLDVLVVCLSSNCAGVQVDLSMGNGYLMGIENYFQGTLSGLQQHDPQASVCSGPESSSLFAQPIPGEYAIGAIQETICSPEYGSDILLAIESQVNSSCTDQDQDYVGDEVAFTYPSGSLSSDLSSQFASIVGSVYWPFSSFCV